MSARLMLLQLGATEVPVAVGAKIHRADLYGRQVKTVECGGEPLEKVVLDPEGRVFLPCDITYIATDSDGSLVDPPITISDDGEELDIKPSSFREKRELEPAGLEALARLRVDAVMPVECTLAVGFYTTKYTYHDGPVLKDAVLNVTPAGAFLLTGTAVEVPLQDRAQVYDFFEPDGRDAKPDDDDEISFEMF
jgi:hypothetical protein